MYSYRYKCYIHSTILSSQFYEIITRPPTIWTSLNGSYPCLHIVGEVISSSEGTAIQFVWKYNLLQAWIPSSVLIDEQKLVLNLCNLFNPRNTISRPCPDSDTGWPNPDTKTGTIFKKLPGRSEVRQRPASQPGCCHATPSLRENWFQWKTKA